MGVIMLTVWVAKKVKVSPANFHRLKVAALDQKQRMVPPLKYKPLGSHLNGGTDFWYSPSCPF